jgi:alkylation response protein AidB-like acyl-CoA dehydrogenase
MPIANRQLEKGERIVLAEGAIALSTHRRAVHLWELLTAMALVGLGRRALELGLEYVLQREAFGVPVANFQTVQHRLADNATALDGARLLAYEAAWMHDVDSPAADAYSSMAALFAAEVAFKTAADSLQLHGGYGYTLEYDIQLYFRRAKAWPLLAGDPRRRYSELAYRLYDSEGT